MEILSISIPDQLRSLLDAETTRQERSRSFIVRQAIEEYLARRGDPFRAARDRTLQENLALTPIERLRLSEELWRGLNETHQAVKAARRRRGHGS